MSFARFMAGSVGRTARVVIGIGLIVWGFSIGSTAGVVVIVVGAIVFLAGALNFCLIAPLIKAPFLGKATLGSH
jgi:hypothetical protein